VSAEDTMNFRSLLALATALIAESYSFDVVSAEPGKELGSLLTNCTGKITYREYDALESLYNATAGWNWLWDPLLPSSTVWQFPSDLSAPCSNSWQGLRCTQTLNESTCNITTISLERRNLKGSLPSEIGNFQSLRALYLFVNFLTGTIPTQLGNLVQLTDLVLDINSIGGTLPSEMGNLRNLEVLDLYYNLLVGTIPTELGSLVNMELIFFDSNSLEGTIPSELSNLVFVKALGISDNFLNGAIPLELGELVNMNALSLSSNWLEGTIPSELGSLAYMTELFLDGNFLEGSIPSELGQLVNMEVLYLYDNSLNDTIPSELSNLVHMRSLGLNSNYLEGTIPSELGDLDSVEVLSLNANLLTGGIPPELADLANLEGLYINDNPLGGTIPAVLGNLISMKALYLSTNGLVGAIPSELSELVNLAVLDLHSNSLGGSIPSELGGLVNISTFDISNNFFTGSLPSTITRLSLLQYLNLSFNQYSGPVEPLTRQNFSFLEVVDLSNNHFVGTLPAGIFMLPSLQTIVASQNCFSGRLPWSMCHNSNLENIVLDLLTGNCGSNAGVLQGFVLRQYMVGTIPACIWNTSSIRVLHLLGNGLTGRVADLSADSSLSVLALGSNQLSGAIPITFQHHNFTQLDLSINRLSGTLESDLSVNDKTTVCDLSVNRLSGRIPDDIFHSFGAGVINILQGNLFGCQQLDIPSSDVDHNSYQCGSVDFEASILAWFVCVCSVTVAVIVMVLAGSELTGHTIRATCLQVLGVLAGPVGCVAIAIFGLVGFVSAKLLGPQVTTHSVQYWWTSTAVYAHGWTITVYMFLLLSASCVVFTMSMMSLAAAKNVHCKASAAQPFAITVCRCIAAHSVNVAVVTAMNAIYVLVAVGSLNSVALLSVQAALGTFKLVWSACVIPRLVSRAITSFSFQLPHWVFMVLFVFLGAPFASSFSESSSCFLYVLTEPSLNSFSFIVSSVSTQLICVYDRCQFMSAAVPELFQSSILSPWMYSYQCSSAVITSYAPVLIWSYLMSGVLVPLTWLLMSYYRPPLPLFAVIKKILPVVVFEMTYVDNPSAAMLLENKTASKLGRRMAVKFILNFAVMLTFGLVVPLFDFAVLWDTAFHMGLMMLLLDKFVWSCKCNGLDAGGVKQEFWSSLRLQTRDVTICCYIVLGYISVFWSLFAFDWIGDVYGSLAGGLSMLVPLILPTLIGFCLLTSTRLRGQTAIVGQPSDGIELHEVANPVILPQSTVDAFSEMLTN
jgi:Leucine-rich repeat (LRR) protein